VALITPSRYDRQTKEQNEPGQGVSGDALPSASNTKGWRPAYSRDPPLIRWSGETEWRVTRKWRIQLLAIELLDCVDLKRRWRISVSS
jgi:hypothetical protein